MPREQINYSQGVEYGEPSDTNPDDAPHALIAATAVTHIDTETPVLHVGWLRAPDGGGWVQVHFEADVTYFQFAAENPNASTPDSPAPRSTVYTPVLTRSEINKLIRVLKRARDQAYGRDE